ncbi:MAG: hypothetical protein V4486_02715 [Patescibacteria group bacterium]
MQENIEQKLWNKKLAEEGMPEELPDAGTALQQQGEARQLLLQFDPDLEKPMNKLADLSEEMQDNIFAYILHERNDGMSKEEAAKLLDFLINKTFEMLDMSEGQSDKSPKPVPSNLEPELQKRAEKLVERTIKEAHATIVRDSFRPKGDISKYKH